MDNVFLVCLQQPATPMGRTALCPSLSAGTMCVSSPTGSVTETTTVETTQTRSSTSAVRHRSVLFYQKHIWTQTLHKSGTFHIVTPFYVGDGRSLYPFNGQILPSSDEPAWIRLVSSVDIPCDPPFRFRCDNNRCIYSHELCNSVDDCGDGTDERQEHCECGPITSQCWHTEGGVGVRLDNSTNIGPCCVYVTVANVINTTCLFVPSKLLSLFPSN